VLRRAEDKVGVCSLEDSNSSSREWTVVQRAEEGVGWEAGGNVAEGVTRVGRGWAGWGGVGGRDRVNFGPEEVVEV